MNIRTYFNAALVAVAFVVLGSNVSVADITFTAEIDTTPVLAGEAATVSFFAESNVAGGEDLSGFNLAVDIGEDGAGLTSGLSIPTVGNPISPINGNASLAVGGPQNDNFGTDVIINIVNGSVFTIADSQTLLFDLQIDTETTTDIGTYSVLIDTNSPFFDVVAGDGTTNLTGSASAGATSGSFVITAVPEPSGLALIVAGLGGLALRRRR